MSKRFKDCPDGLEKFEVPTCAPMAASMYLSPGGTQLLRCDNGVIPDRPAADEEGSRIVRVVCISDTHLEHEALRLPAGDLLLHAGDCLTESGDRYVKRCGRDILEVKEQGVALFEHFAKWFGALDFAAKVVIGGNHDLVVQGLGKDRVQEMLDRHTTAGRCVYLEHEEVSIDGIRIFGSPYCKYPGKNDAFFGLSDYSDLPEGVQIVMTHYPCLLPGRNGLSIALPELAQKMHQIGAVLHVSGHCHWARGLYLSQQPGSAAVPCVNAAVCGSMYGGPWPDSKPELLVSAQGVRVDPRDRDLGGYLLDQAPVVCDLQLPGAQGESGTEAGIVRTASMTESLDSEPSPHSQSDDVSMLRMLVFGPPNDPCFVRHTLPRFCEMFNVDWVEDTVDGLVMVADHTYQAVVAKLGTQGNLSYPVIKAFREKQGTVPFVAIDS